MAKSHAPYPASFRADAVALVRRSGKRIGDSADNLGGSGASLRTWVQQAKADAGEGPPDALTTAEREELRRLSREHETLVMEREIVKQAAAFAASETW